MFVVLHNNLLKQSEYVSKSPLHIDPLHIDPHTSYIAACMASCVFWHALQDRKALVQIWLLRSPRYVA